MPLAVLKYLGLRPIELIMMQLLMADRTIKKLVGILFDVLEKVDNLIFFGNFVVLYF